nr:tyrosine-type recombinase/integrase [Actinoplanes utahensis]
MLRHTYASTLLADGVDIRTLAEYRGHSDPGFTLRTYTHLMPSAPDKTRRAVDRGAVDGSPVVSDLVPRSVEQLNPRSERGALRRCSTSRTRAGSGGAGPGRSRWCACSRSRWRSGRR